MMNLTDKLDFQLRVNYRAPRTTTQGKSKSMTGIDLAFSQDILKDNATVSLSVNDLLNTQLRRYTTYGEDFYSDGSYRWRRRQVVLSFNYRLNQKKKRSREGNRGNDFDGGEF